MDTIGGIGSIQVPLKGKRITRGRKELRVHFLGTSSATPTHTRGVSANAIELPSSRIWLVDCGDGTQKQILKSNLAFERIDRILITHLHGDHCYGLFGLLAMLAMKNSEYPVELIGPVGMEKMVHTVFELSQMRVTYPLTITELREGESTLFPALDGWVLSAHPLTHRVPCFGYVIQEIVPGVFSGEKAFSLGATKTHMKSLSKGGGVTLGDGRQLLHQECLTEEWKGRKVVLMGDTCSSEEIAGDAAGCDLLVHEATYDSSLADKALRGGHSTSTQAGEFARRIRAKRLVITHFSARYTQPWNGEEDLSVGDLLREAQEAAGDVEVLAADDGMTVDVLPLRRR